MYGYRWYAVGNKRSINTALAARQCCMQHRLPYFQLLFMYVRLSGKTIKRALCLLSWGVVPHMLMRKGAFMLFSLPHVLLFPPPPTRSLSLSLSLSKAKSKGNTVLISLLLSYIYSVVLSSCFSPISALCCWRSSDIV